MNYFARFIILGIALLLISIILWIFGYKED